MAAAQASTCAYCNAVIVEGSNVLYDDYRDQHFCHEECFAEWFFENHVKIRSEYRALNVNAVDV